MFQTLEWDHVLAEAEGIEERTPSAFSGGVLCTIAAIAAHRGRLEEAERLLDRSTVSPDAGDPQTRATWATWRGYLHQVRGDDRATIAATDLEIGKVMSPHHSLAKPSAVMQGVSAARLGDPRARRFLELVERLPAAQRTPLYLGGAHRVRALLGEAPDAEFAAAEAAYEASGHRWELAETLRDHAHALLGQGRAAEAEPVIERALALYEEAGAKLRARELRTLRAAPVTGAAETA